jgi:hypothetical protein
VNSFAANQFPFFQLAFSGGRLIGITETIAQGLLPLIADMPSATNYL